jgi:hypothetical protein
MAPDIVNSGRGGTRFGLSVDMMGSSVSQVAVGSYMAIPPQEAGQVDFSLPTIAVATEVDPRQLAWI